jgi:hypothetical protein
MALTRPNLYNIQTNVAILTDPITVLHGGASQANVDVGFLMNRANGLVSNVALYWNEAGQTFVTAFTSNSGATDTNVSVISYANVAAGNIYASGTNSRHGYTWANNVSSSYTVFNSSTNSIDTVFG